MKVFKRIIGIIAVVAVMASFAPFVLACSDKGGTSGSECAIYAASSTAKFLQNDDLSASGEVFASPHIVTCTGESESAQILIAAKEKISGYTVTVSDLKNENNDVLSASNIELFVMKYHNVVMNSKYSNSTEKGKYPDAMLPYETACEYGENNIEQGENQSIFIRLNVPIGQKSGTYRGSVTVKTGDKTRSVELTADVYDIELKNRTFRSCFDLRMTEFMSYTLDITKEKYAKYFEDMLSYDMCALFLPGYEDMKADLYLEQIKKYWDNPHFNSYGIPVRTIQGIDIDAGVLAEYLETIALAGENDGKDYLSRAYLYITLIDEPQGRDIMDLCKYISERVIEAKRIAIENITDNDLSSDIVSVSAAINGVPNLVTEEYVPEFDGLIDIFCPTFDKYDEPYKNDIYKSLGERGDERWWYGCVNPGKPYPSYHIDERFVSGRLAQWMAMENGVVGNLYWDMTFDVSIDGLRNSLGNSDFYDGVPNRYFNANGDGYMCYPGELYGIDGLVPSVRMEGYRDGAEDYEAFVILDDLYKAKGYDAKRILSAITDDMFYGTRYYGNSLDFESARKKLLDCIVLAKRGVFFTDFDYPDGEAKLTVYTSTDGVTVNGNAATENELKVFAATDNNSFDVVCGNTTISFAARKVKARKIFDEQSASAMLSGANGVTVSFGETSEGTMAITDFPTEHDGRSGYVKLGGADVASLTNDDIFVLYIYSETQTRVRFAVGSSGSPVLTPQQTYNLKVGMNVVEVGSFGFFDFGKNGKIKNVCMYVGEKSTEPIRAGIKGYTVYSR